MRISDWSSDVCSSDLLTQDQKTGRWRMTASGADGDIVIDAGHVISSAPMRELAARIHPLPACALNAAPNLKYRDFLTVALKIRSEDLFPDNWIYIHDSKVQVGRSEEHTSELQSLMRISYAVFC